MIINTELEKEKSQAPKKKIFHNPIYDSPFPELEHCEEFNSIVECNYSAHDLDLEERFDAMCDFLNKKNGKIKKHSKTLFHAKQSFIESNIDNVFTEEQIITPIKISHRNDLLKRNYIGIQREKQLNRFMFFLNIYKSKIKTTLQCNIFEKKMFISKTDETEYISLIEAIESGDDFDYSNENNNSCCNESDVYESEIYESDKHKIYIHEDTHEDTHNDIFYECMTEISDGNILIDQCEKSVLSNNNNIVDHSFIFENIIKKQDYTDELDLYNTKIPCYVSGFYELIEESCNEKNIIESVKNITNEDSMLYMLHMRNSNEFKNPSFFLNFEKEAKQEKAECIADMIVSDLAQRKMLEETIINKQLCEADKIMSEARILGIT